MLDENFKNEINQNEAIKTFDYHSDIITKGIYTKFLLKNKNKR